MDFDDILRAIVPLTFLVVWALSSLFNRETKPLPNRPGGLGPRPGGLPPGPRPIERAGVPLARDPTLRWGNPTAADPPPLRRPASKPDQEILVIRSEPTRGAGTAAPARRAARAMAQPTAPKRSDSAIARSLTGTPAQTLPHQIGRPLEFMPLTDARQAAAAPQAPAAAPLPSQATLAARAFDLRGILSARDRLQEAVILAEVLQPPLALRRRRL